jgi:hypothetical protein
MLTPTSNSSQIRRYRSPNFDCQSPFLDSFQSSEPSGWPTGHRPAPTHGHAVATVRRPGPHLSGCEGFKGATMPHSPSLAPCSLSLSLSPRSGGETERHSRRGLPRARAPSSPCLDPIPPNNSTTAPSSTLSTLYVGRLSEGKAALADFTTAAMCGTSPESRPPWSE